MIVSPSSLRTIVYSLNVIFAPLFSLIFSLLLNVIAFVSLLLNSSSLTMMVSSVYMLMMLSEPLSVISRYGSYVNDIISSFSL